MVKNLLGPMAGGYSLEQILETYTQLEAPPPDEDLCDWMGTRVKTLLEAPDLELVDRRRLDAVLERLTLLKERDDE